MSQVRCLNLMSRSELCAEEKVADATDGGLGVFSRRFGKSRAHFVESLPSPPFDCLYASLFERDA